MISTFNHLEQKILDVKYNRIEQGLGLGVEYIDEFLRYKRGSFNIAIGHANVGKTTVILYLMLAYSMKHDLKWLIFSSENTSYSVARKLLEFRVGKPVQKLSDDTIRKELDWIYDHFKIIEVEKVYTARELMSEALALKKVWDYNGLLIDPYNSLAKDPTLLRSIGAHEYDYQIASEMRLFCKNNNITIWLNAHGVTEALRRVYEKGHEFEGLPKPCNLASVEGGGKWGNRADDVISIHRMTQHSTLWNVSEIHVLKVKETETGGRPTSQDNPIALKMMAGNVDFTVAGMDIIKRNINHDPNAGVKPQTDLIF